MERGFVFAPLVKAHLPVACHVTIGYQRRSTFASLDEDTIVFVLGDHGMTETGDHGGEGQLETDAGLLIYSKRPIFDPWQVYLCQMLCNIPSDMGNTGKVWLI